MPLYEYECQQCHRRTEKRQKFSDPEITECPHCGGHLERVLSAPAISFKGGGWYKDLYSSAKPAAAPAADGKSESKSDGGASTPAPATAAASGENGSSSTPKPAAAPASSTPASAPASSATKN